MKLKLALSLMAMVMFMAAGSAYAMPYTMDFTNATLDLGAVTQIDLTNQYSTFGLNFSHIYRYIDAIDPFDGFGISNGNIAETGATAATGSIIFASTTNFVSFDWLTINGNCVITAFDASNNVLSTFVGNSSNGNNGSGVIYGTNTINATGIKYLALHDDGGSVGISNLTYDRNPVPEPATMLLLGIGLLGAGIIRRKK